MVRSLLILCSLLLTCAAPATHAGAPEAAGARGLQFNGTWVPSSEKQSKPDAGPDGWTNMTIEVRDPKVKFILVYPAEARPRKRELTFYTDQRGETNKSAVYFFLLANKQMADEDVSSKTKWDSDALVVVHRMVVHDGPVTLNTDLTMRWEVSGDGKTLNRTMKTVVSSATYLQKTAEGERLLQLPVRGKEGEETKDTFVLLEARR